MYKSAITTKFTAKTNAINTFIGDILNASDYLEPGTMRSIWVIEEAIEAILTDLSKTVAVMHSLNCVSGAYTDAAWQQEILSQVFMVQDNAKSLLYHLRAQMSMHAMYRCI